MAQVVPSQRRHPGEGRDTRQAAALDAGN